MNKITIVLLIIIGLICSALLIVTGYISFRVYTKPSQEIKMEERMPMIRSVFQPEEIVKPEQIIQPEQITGQELGIQTEQIIQPEYTKQQKQLSEHNIGDYTVQPESLSVTIPTAELSFSTSSETKQITKPYMEIVDPTILEGRVKEGTTEYQKRR